MGCSSSNIQVVKPGRKQTVFGVFEVVLKQAHIQHQTSTFSTMDPYVVLKFSNQTFKGTVVKKGGINPKFSDICKFYVNSYYKHLGRCLEVELMDSNIGSDDDIGYGIIDLDPYLNALKISTPGAGTGNQQLDMKQSKPEVQPQPQKATLRCFLNYKRKQAGFVVLEAIFKEQKTNVIHLRFETASLQRSTKTFGDMENCYVRVTAGEQVLQTQKSKDTKTDQPVWKDEHLTFTCPKSLEKIQIQVLNQNDLIGSCEVIKAKTLIDQQESEFKEELIFDGKVAGTIWFNSKCKANVVFKQLNGNYKKVSQTKPQEKKDDEEKKEKKEDDKKEEKKQQEKKQDDKKEEEKKQEKKQEKKEENKQNPAS